MSVHTGSKCVDRQIGHKHRRESEEDVSLRRDRLAWLGREVELDIDGPETVARVAITVLREAARTDALNAGVGYRRGVTEAGEGRGGGVDIGR